MGEVVPYSAVQGYSGLLGQVRAAGLADLDRLFASLAGEPTRVCEEALRDVLPVLGDQYAGTVSMISAEFFDELQDVQGVRKRITPDIVEGPPKDSWHALAGWATSGKNMFEATANDLVYRLVVGGFTKRLTEQSADTMIGNAQAQGSMGYQRVPAAGCCPFCAMLATRGAAYTSAESAGGVVGRGSPIPGAQRRGGQAKGIRPRGSRTVGQAFHDNCSCRVVAVDRGNAVEMGEHAEQYMAAYAKAAQKVGGGLETRHFGQAGSRSHAQFDASGSVVSTKEETNRIVQEMERLLTV